MSIDFGVALSAIISVSIGGGSFSCNGAFGCKMGTDRGSWFGMGIGLKSDLSAEVGANVLLWNGADAIPGWAGNFAVGADMSPSECGADFALVHSFAPAYVTALGFSVGCGVGIMPVEVQWLAGYSWASFPACSAAETYIAGSEEDESFSDEDNLEEGGFRRQLGSDKPCASLYEAQSKGYTAEEMIY